MRFDISIGTDKHTLYCTPGCTYNAIIRLYKRQKSLVEQKKKCTYIHNYIILCLLNNNIRTII